MKIILPHGENRRLANDLKVNRLSVSRALSFKNSSPRSKMIRAVAIQRGGYIYESPKNSAGHLPDCETTFNTVDNTMVQTFSDRVAVISNLTTGTFPYGQRPIFNKNFYPDEYVYKIITM